MVDLGGTLSLAACYLVIFLVGFLASLKKRGKSGQATVENFILADRKLGKYVSMLTVTATSVCGAYLIGIPEVIYNPGRYGGLLWCLMPVGGAICGILCGLLFARPYHESGFLTMVDPFELHYGTFIGLLLALVSIFTELMWTAAAFGALSTTISVVMDTDSCLPLVISSSVVVMYTAIGGLNAAVFTDAVQIIFVFFGLWICVPFAKSDSRVHDFRLTATKPSMAPNATHGWMGELQSIDIAIWVDNLLLFVFGGIPWASMLQRLLACRTTAHAKRAAVTGGVSFFVLAFPSIMSGAIAASTEWEQTDYNSTLAAEDARLVLPLVLRYLTPTGAAYLGLGAIAAAVMSSADSTLLASSTLFSQNIYNAIARKRATEKEILMSIRVFMVLMGILTTALALLYTDVHHLYTLSADISYVVIFPQLFSLVYFRRLLNAYGVLFSVLLGLTLRFLCGDPNLGLAAVIKLPMYSENSGIQLFPYRTFCMFVSAVSLFAVSQLAELLFRKLLPLRCDVLGAFGMLSSDYKTIVRNQSSQTDFDKKPVGKSDCLLSTHRSPVQDSC